MGYQTIPWYQLKAAVGKNASNSQADVKLLHAVLALWGSGQNASSLLTWAAQASVELEPMKVTGKCDENLQAWIDMVNGHIARESHTVAWKQGVIEPIPTDHRNDLILHRNKYPLFYSLQVIALKKGGMQKFLAIQNQAGAPFEYELGDSLFRVAIK